MKIEDIYRHLYTMFRISTEHLEECVHAYNDTKRDEHIALNWYWLDEHDRLLIGRTDSFRALRAHNKRILNSSYESIKRRKGILKMLYRVRLISKAFDSKRLCMDLKSSVIDFVVSKANNRRARKEI